MIQRLVTLLVNWRTIGFWLIGLALFGYSLFKTQAINNPSPDSNYLKQQQSAKPAEIKIKPELRAELEQLVETAVDLNLNPPGQGDPFNP